MDNQPQATDHHLSTGYYILADLMGHWEQGELTMEEVLARWPHEEELPPDGLVHELLRTLLLQARRIAALERWAIAARRATG